jgi:hypothetical protein
MSTYTVQRQVRLDQVTAQALRQVAVEQKSTVSDVIRRAIECEIYHHYNNAANK